MCVLFYVRKFGFELTLIQLPQSASGPPVAVPGGKAYTVGHLQMHICRY
jgi:hypothetical protein